MARLLSIPLFVATLAGAAVLAQQPVPLFRAGAKTVAIYATVLDKNGQLVPDLVKEDFEILDNGKPQATSVFVSDVQFIKVVVLLDESGSMVNNLELVKDAAEQFMLRLLPQDVARIGSFEDKIIISPTFTNNRDELIHFMRNDLQYGNGTLLWDAVTRGLDALDPLDGRRVVLVFTDGDDDGSRTHFGDLLKRARDQEFMVYAIGFHSRYRGGPNGEMVESSPASDLKKLAGDTGGGFYELRQGADLNSTFTRVAEELHRQYVLGFTPTVLDGKVHTLEVKVKKPGMTARTRKSYLASPDK